MKIVDNSTFNPFKFNPVQWSCIFCAIPERPQTGHFQTTRFLWNSYVGHTL